MSGGGGCGHVPVFHVWSPRFAPYGEQSLLEELHYCLLPQAVETP